MAKLIEVEERDIDYIFGKSKPYSLDVYQRDYRWSDDREYKIVTQLLIDIELRFENNLKQQRKNNRPDLPSIYKDVSENFKAYFLNTIMLNEQGGDIFIVDGQQRLTTILLILIKLYSLGMSEDVNGMNIEKILGEKIFEEDKAGIKHFKISNIDRNEVIRKIFESAKIADKDITTITQYNLVQNYDIISKHFDNYFYDEGDKFDGQRYNYYVYNLTEKVLIIEQVIKHKEDVAMIFETANDRGKELEPHEVLKGMLLGVLENKVKEECNFIWNEALKTFFAIDDNYKNVDEFFRTYFRAKYADNQSQYQSFAGKYHRNLLSNDRIVKDLDRGNPSQIEGFIKNDFKYFYKLYLEILKHAIDGTEISIASNYANEQGQQSLLILSALTLNDPERDEKISLVARKFDQFYTLSNLIGIYDNNEMQKIVYDLTREIRNKPLDQIEKHFDKVTVAYFNSRDISIRTFNDIFHYKYFEKTRVNGRFSKYLLARIDYYLADLLNEQSFAKQESLSFITHSGSKPINGFHIEHMFSHNEKIMDQFKDMDGEFDENLFTEERNRLGAVILLKGNENIRTSNNLYEKKLSSYSNSGFIWNRILTGSINKASLNSCKHTIKNEFKNYIPDANGLLERNAIEERQQLLFKLITEVYSGSKIPSVSALAHLGAIAKRQAL